MDKCSSDLIALIVEHPCASDTGRTSRSLGLVSKDLRALAKPLEFRALVIAGPEQLKRTIVGIERARMSLCLDELSGARVDVRHVFIHDLELEHALAIDSDPDLADHFWETPTGERARTYYSNESAAFWKSVAALIHTVSTTLVTLAVIQRQTIQWNQLRSTLFSGNVVLGVLSGVHLPRLVSLTLKNISSQGSYKVVNHRFIPPTLPSLRKLCIVGKPAHKKDQHGNAVPYPYLHPLLAGMHSRFSNLTHLVLRDVGAFDVNTLASVLSGTRSISTRIEDHCLPGKLISVILQQGAVPRFRRNKLRRRYMREISGFVDIVNGLRIRGLEAYLPTPRGPEGNTLSETLLAEWAERALRRG